MFSVSSLFYLQAKILFLIGCGPGKPEASFTSFGELNYVSSKNFDPWFFVDLCFFSCLSFVVSKHAIQFMVVLFALLPFIGASFCLLPCAGES